ncbi:MAG: C25 family cysteine peptidase [Bacteroidetes bacterium]|nr:C25 family cysteine peptidase [Bacteroidota bacterium]MCL1969206.1 C25 family cysteine peptidase [Bacteroidota bacterium]
MKNLKNDTKERYLMITAPAFDSIITTFADYKRTIGFDVQVVNTTVSGKTASSIKKYIQSQYDNPATRPTYLLLVGDVDAIPAYEGIPSGKVKDKPVSDLGYSLLSGNDLFADVFLGRFSVANESQLQNIIDKTIYMETNMHLFKKKAKFISGDEAKGVWNRVYMKSAFHNGNEYIVRHIFTPLGYDCEKLYKPDKTAVCRALSDNPLFFIYAGHGVFTSFAGKSFTFESVDILTATNTVFPFVFAFACKTGNFAQTCSIGEAFIRAKEKGAVTYFGASVISQTNTDPIIQKRIFDEIMKQEAQSISSMINLGMRRFTHAAGIRKKVKERYLKAYNLLGDPSFNLNGVRN